ncbi:MAG: hydrogenase maturation nickel metallochaperone HypA [Desulfobacterales bacterium]|nr:hydrogenase maturation nickel metallochaperone HypA [Desulfobacterales bacterium]
MHEMGIAMEIIEIAEASIPAGMDAVQVERVNLRVGKLSAIVPDSLTFCFGVAIKDTRLEGATLNIEQVPVVAMCKDCDAKWTIEEPAFNCPECQSGSIELISGKELDILSIEILDEDESE